MMKLRFFTASDQGWVRGNNEDSAYAGPHLLALADGMGGHAAGEVASQLMIHHLANLDADPEDNDVLALLAAVADDANRAIAAHVRENPETNGMGTTLTALMFNGREFGMCHVGDSRGYRLRDGKLEQITVDDTYVQSLVEKGELDPEDVSTHPQRSLILKAYTGREVEPTLKTLDAKVGDRILLCSDGLSDPVTATTIEEALRQGTPEEAAYRLIELALRSGGPDNVTIVVADVVDGSAESEPLPTVAQMSGAISGGADTDSDSHPDTAASRAARVMKEREPQTIPPAQAKNAHADAPAGKESSADDKPKRSSKGAIATLVVVLLALVAGGAGYGWFNSQLSDTYFINAVDEELVIEQGSNASIFGKDFHSIYQVACIDEKATLGVYHPDEVPTSCHRFSLNDLQETARGQVATLPEGDYNSVMDQMQRLTAETLPVCVTRQASKESTSKPTSTARSSAKRTSAASETSSAKETSSEAAPSSAAREASEKPSEPTSAASKTPAPGDLGTPGLDCREV